MNVSKYNIPVEEFIICRLWRKKCGISKNGGEKEIYVDYELKIRSKF